MENQEQEIDLRELFYFLSDAKPNRSGGINECPAH